MGLVLIKNYVVVAIAIMLYQISRTLPPFFVRWVVMLLCLPLLENQKILWGQQTKIPDYGN